MLTKQNGRPERTYKKQLIILSPSLSPSLFLCLSLSFSDTPANDMCRPLDSEDNQEATICQTSTVQLTQKQKDRESKNCIFLKYNFFL